MSAALELLDSRYDGYRVRLADVLADNTSAAGFLVGPQRVPATIEDLGDARCCVRVDGTVVAEAAGSAILGDPLLALVRLSEHLAERGTTLAAGAVVLAGAMTDAVPVRPGSTYEVEIDGLGTVTYRA